ncbi:MAG TPA: deoxyguanosinetriphosphate triphosphohydrolase [Pirellulales bacterium]|jgi:dGTPase|nr:deoxyguanosinetriphosphate triphosphohydrolase [Pirellulales bacterium]
MPSSGSSAFAEREAMLLAPYAMHSVDSAGRKHPEPPHAYRAPFARDRDRIIHSAAYRRLSYKTQVFTGELGDYHRSRLTHTLEVSLIARTLGRTLRLNEDLVEALAVQHDIGHPPFGHSGEETLDECLRTVGGFSHNRQALRIVEQLERRYPTFPGLNLSREVLAGQAARAEKTTESLSESGRGLSPFVSAAADSMEAGQKGTVSLSAGGTRIGAESRRPLLETQVVDAADSVAYDTHDADDAMELGLLALDDLLEVPLWREAARRVNEQYAGLAGPELRRAVLHELIDWQAGDLLAESQKQLGELKIDSVEAVRRAPVAIRHSAELADLKSDLEAMLHDRVYRHPQVLEMRAHAQARLEEMFNGYLQRPELLPEGFLARAASTGLLRTVGDYLAGMTDRFALREHARLFASA